jgi:hypothetical protein
VPIGFLGPIGFIGIDLDRTPLFSFQRSRKPAAAFFSYFAVAVSLFQYISFAVHVKSFFSLRGIIFRAGFWLSPHRQNSGNLYKPETVVKDIFYLFSACTR